MLSVVKTAYSLVTPTKYGINMYSSDVSIAVALEQVLK